MQNLLTDYMETMLSKVSSVIEPGLTQLDKPELIAIKNTLQNSILAYKQIVKETKDKFIVETQRFNKEVLNALYNQINTLEQNLGGDLMKQFDAIERLNELKPERIWIMLEETRSELTMHLNSVYSRILREINTLQLQVDISKVSLILTNEAGKAIKRVDKMAEVEYENATLIMELLEILKTKSIEVD